MFVRRVDRKVRSRKWVLDAKIFFSLSLSANFSFIGYALKALKKSTSVGGLKRRVGLVRLLATGKRNLVSTYVSSPLTPNSHLNQRIGRRRSYFMPISRQKCLKSGRSRGVYFGTSRLRFIRNSFRGSEASTAVCRW